MARFSLSQNERLLLHLMELDRYRDDPEVPLGASQEGISDRLQTQVHNVSRALAALEAEGLVCDRLAHVRGAPKRRRAYFLTEKGRQAAQTVRSDVGKRRVLIEDDGRVEEIAVDNAVLKVSSATGQALTFFEFIEVARQSDSVKLGSLRRAGDDRYVSGARAERSLGKPKIESFFGRDREIKDIAGALSGDDRSAVLVWGMPGIGKSTLGARVFDSLSGRRSMFWHSFRDWDTESSFLGAMVDFLRSLGKGETAEAVKRGHVTADLFHPFAKDLSGTDAILFLDDVHKAAKHLELVLSVLLDSVRASGSAKVVLMSRSVPAFFSKAHPGNLVIELAGLDRDSARKMAESAKAADALRAVDESHGHPLLIRLMASGKYGETRGDVISYIEREVYSAVTPAERSVLELLSIFRHPVGMDALGQVDYSVIAVLRQRALVVEQESGVWTHDLLKEFFASRTSADRRAELHRVAAAHCSDHAQVEWKLETLYHLVEARDWQSSRRAVVASAAELGKEFPGEFLELVNRIPMDDCVPRERAEILFVKGQLREHAGDSEGALRDYEASLSLLPSEADSATRAAVLESMAALQAEVKHWAESFSAHEKALKLYEESEDKEGQAREWMSIGSVHRRRGDLVKARESYMKALKLASMDENRAAQAAALNNLALLDWDEGRVMDAEMRLKESVKFAHLVKDHMGAAKGLENLAELYRSQFKLSEMTSLLWESSEAFRRAGEFEEFKRLQAACAESLGHQGRVQDGIDLCRTTLEKPELRKRKGLFQKGQAFDQGDVALSMTLIELLRKAGDYKAALKEVGRLSSMGESMGDRSLLAKARLELSMVHEGSGALEQAVKPLEDAEIILRREGDNEGLIAVQMRKGIIYEKLGDEASAIRSYSEAARHAELSGNERARMIALDGISGLRSG